jgi:hypothetical protein
MIKVITQSNVRDLDLLAKIPERVEPKNVDKKDNPTDK